jgi:hypothetical protein
MSKMEFWMLIFLKRMSGRLFFGSYAEGASGPDGLSFLFYQHSWELIKEDFMPMVHD